MYHVYELIINNNNITKIGIYLCRINCKTRRVAVYLGTQCNIGSKRVCTADPWWVTLNREVRSCADRRNLLFLWTYSAQTLRSPPKLSHKRAFVDQSQSQFDLNRDSITSRDSIWPLICVRGIWDSIREISRFDLKMKDLGPKSHYGKRWGRLCFSRTVYFCSTAV